MGPVVGPLGIHLSEHWLSQLASEWDGRAPAVAQCQQVCLTDGLGLPSQGGGGGRVVTGVGGSAETATCRGVSYRSIAHERGDKANVCGPPSASGCLAEGDACCAAVESTATPVLSRWRMPPVANGAPASNLESVAMKEDGNARAHTHTHPQRGEITVTHRGIGSPSQMGQPHPQLPKDLPRK